jgi:DNA-directed RNA polymerase subunit H (RpoH/RPB5)
VRKGCENHQVIQKKEEREIVEQFSVKPYSLFKKEQG